MNTLPRTDSLKKICTAHALTSKANTSLAAWAQIESVLASHLASIAYAEAEARIQEYICGRVAQSTPDTRVHSYVRFSASRLVRSIKISELSGILGHFGDECKSHFSATISDKQKSDWDSLMGSRHSTAHQTTSPAPHLTLTDVDGYLASVSEVLALFRSSLNQ